MERTDCILGFQLDNAIVINGFLYRVQHIHITRDYVVIKRKLEALRNILLIKGNIHIKQFKANIFTSLHACSAKKNKEKYIFHTFNIQKTTTLLKIAAKKSVDSIGASPLQNDKKPTILSSNITGFFDFAQNDETQSFVFDASGVRCCVSVMPMSKLIVATLNLQPTRL